MKYEIKMAVVLDTSSLIDGYYNDNYLDRIYVGTRLVWPPSATPPTPPTPPEPNTTISVVIEFNFPAGVYALIKIQDKPGDPGENGFYGIYSGTTTITDVDASATFVLYLYRNNIEDTGSIPINGSTYELGSTTYLYYFGISNGKVELVFSEWA